MCVAVSLSSLVLSEAELDKMAVHQIQKKICAHKPGRAGTPQRPGAGPASRSTCRTIIIIKKSSVSSSKFECQYVCCKKSNNRQKSGNKNHHKCICVYKTHAPADRDRVVKLVRRQERLRVLVGVDVDLGERIVQRGLLVACEYTHTQYTIMRVTVSARESFKNKSKVNRSIKEYIQSTDPPGT
jgi:hypothetical protein